MARIFPNRIRREEPQAAPGYARREELKVQADQLEQQADEMNAQADVGAIDPNALLPDDEIQSILSRESEEVTNPVPGFCYMWANVEYPANARGSQILALQTKGWHVVNGDMEESIEYKTVDGTRKLGDCILMRIDARRKAAIDHQYELLNAKRMSNDPALIETLQAKYGIKVVSYDNMTDEARTHLDKQAAKQFAKRAAEQRIHQDLRQGTVPGVQPGR